MFVGLGFLLLRGGKDYRIDHSYEIVDEDSLTDAFSSLIGERSIYAREQESYDEAPKARLHVGRPDVADEASAPSHIFWRKLRGIWICLYTRITAVFSAKPS